MKKNNKHKGRGLRYFYTEPCNIKEDTLFIEGQELYHLKKVIRLNAGDECFVLDGNGRRYKVSINSIDNRKADCRIHEKNTAPGEKRKYSLGISLLKSGNLDLVIEKAVELGVDRIIPFFSERTDYKYSPDRFDKVAKRWESISIKALKQSHNFFLPKISDPVDFDNLPDVFSDFSKVIVPSPSMSTSFSASLDSGDSSNVLILIGPEGGFSDNEIEDLKDKNVSLVNLGESILRAETAAIVCLGFLRLYAGDK